MLLLRREPGDAVLDEARDTTRRVARTFAIACRLLPRTVRDDVYRLYLVFRALDDLVDEHRPEAEERVAAVEAWCRGARPASREARVLDDLALRHDLPRDALLAFCAGMREDLESRRFAGEQDVDRYCYRVAGTVGIVMASVLGFDGDPEEVRRTAAALGMAMQRTNILRDLDEDGAQGRLYVSATAIDRFGPPEAGQREALLRDQIRRADALYDEGLAGVRHLRQGRRAIRAAAVMYREILRQIERDGYGTQPGRAAVRRRRKLLLALRASV